MATASSSPRRLAPALSRRASSRLVAALPALLVIAVVAVAMKLIWDPWYLNYDARYALLWAHDLWNGSLPEYTADFAPTPHPLQTLVSSLALPFGDDSDVLMSWVILVSFGVLVWLVFALGRELFSTPVGVVTALVVATRPILERDAGLGYQDVPFAMFVILAVLLEARRPRRGLPVLGVLTVAGLMRPEAWLLSGLYVLWLWPASTPRQRLVFIAVAAIAPVVWAVSDWIVTGDPLHSLHGTADLAKANNRRRRVDQVPYWTAKYLGSTLREAPLIGLVVGLAFAWKHRLRGAVLPLVVAGAMLIVFAVGPIFGLPLIGRYVRTPAILIALFYGLAVAGWLMLPRGRDRTRWAWAAGVAVLLSVVFLPPQVRQIDNTADRLKRDGLLYEDLRTLSHAAPVRAAYAACGGLSVADHRPIPYVRFWLRGDPKTVSTPEAGASPLGRVLLLPRPVRPARQFYRDAMPTMAPPAGWRQIYTNRTWRVFAAPSCRF